MLDLNGNTLHECFRENDIERLHTKVDSIIESIGEVRTTQEVQAHILTMTQKSLDEHMRRTELSEKRLDKLELPYKLIAYFLTPLGAIASFAAAVIGILKFIAMLQGK